MKAYKIKYFIAFCFLLFIITPIVITIADDDSSGSFQYDGDNDAPVFIDVYDSSSLIYSNINTTFFAVIQDYDNSTTELTVKLHYSANSFSTTNNISLSYHSLYAIDQYRYNYTFAGQSGGTYYEYYYSVYDGNNTVYENNTGLFYDIQWETAIVPSSGGGTPDDPDPEEYVGTIFEEVLRPQNFYTIALIVASILAFLTGFFFLNRQRQKQRGLIFGFDTKRRFTFRRVAIGSVVVLFISILFVNSYSPMNTFSYNNNQMDYDIRQVGMVDSESIFEVTQTVDRTIYRHYKLTDDATIRSVKMTDREAIFPHELSYNMIVSYDEDPLTNEALWLNTPIVSSSITFSKVVIFSGKGTLVREYSNPPIAQDNLGIFLYENELGNLRGAFNVKYVGAYYNGDVLEKVIFSVYFTLVFEEVM